MHHFDYIDGVLHAEHINLQRLADEVGTPFYCYSEATLRRHFRVFSNAFSGVDALVAYSVKACSNVSILRALAEEGAGADVVSAGELKRAFAAGISPEKIVFSGVGKTRDELALALENAIYQFNVESAEELGLLNTIAIEKGVRAPVAIRVNPDVAAGGHEKISTGKKGDKFGVPWGEAPALYTRALDMDGVQIVGVDVHIGSQIADLAPFKSAFERVAGLIKDLRAGGASIERLDLGGGLGIPYGDDPNAPPHPDDYASMIKEVTAPLDVQLIFEPGRMIAGNAGILIARAVYVKETDEGRYLILDAAMNDLIRPALYDAFHDIQPVAKSSASDTINYDVVGPVCETSDRFAQNRALPPAKPGDLFAIMSAGAYGAVQASQYNSRALVPEVLVNQDAFSVIRRRPSFEEMIALEATAPWLKSS